MRSSIIVCVAAVLLTSLCLAQPPPPVFETIQLPTGEPQDVYALSPFDGVSGLTTVKCEQRAMRTNMQHYDGLIYPTSNRVFFATPIEQDGYHLISGVFGVYDALSDLVAGPCTHTEIAAVPIVGVDEPDTFVFFAKAGQTWASQALVDGLRTDPKEPKIVRVYGAAARAQSMGPGDTVDAELSPATPNALFSLGVEPAKGYQLTLDCTDDSDYDLYLLRPTSETGTVIVDSSVSRVIGAGEAAERLWLVPTAGEEYLALVRYVSGTYGSVPGRGKFSLEYEQLEGPPPKPQWTVIRDDDGDRDSYWGQVTSPSQVLYKVLVVEEDPAEISRAVLQYAIGTEPYDPESKNHLDRGAPEDKEWPDLLVTINDELVLSRPVDEVASMGWHEVAFDPNILRQGENTISFTLADRGAFFYMSIDLDADRDRSYCTRNGEIMPDTLRPTPNRFVGPGEYMVRIKYR